MTSARARVAANDRRRRTGSPASGDMNVLCLGSEVIGPSLARALVAAFVAAEFNTQEPRYAARLEKVSAMERMMKSGEVTAA
jgi:ribose 5-phosphate isomerase RpiB